MDAFRNEYSCGFFLRPDEDASARELLSIARLDSVTYGTHEQRCLLKMIHV